MLDLMTWQDWLVAYLTIGIVVFLSVSVPHLIATRRADSDVPKAAASLFGDPIPASFLESVVAPLIGIAIVCCFWPYALWTLFGEKHFREPQVEEKEFSVSHADLRDRLSFDEVEAKELVFDPLGAVPNLPFGHLNAAWQELKGTPGPLDVLWTFSAPHTQWGAQYIYTGYVVVRDNEIGAFWITDTQRVEAEKDPNTGKQRKSWGERLKDTLRRIAS